VTHICIYVWDGSSDISFRNEVSGLFQEGEGTGKWPTPSSAEVKERVHLHHYFTSGSSWPVLG